MSEIISNKVVTPKVLEMIFGVVGVYLFPTKSAKVYSALDTSWFIMLNIEEISMAEEEKSESGEVAKPKELITPIDGAKATAIARKYLEDNYGNIGVLYYRVEDVTRNGDKTQFYVICSILSAFGRKDRLYYRIKVNISDGAMVETYHISDKTESEKDILKFVEHAEIESPREVKYTKQELIKIFQRANELLRKDGLREGVERFTEFSIILFIKMISEIEDHREKQGLKRRFEKRYCWDSFKNKSGQDILDYINGIILPKLVGKYNDSGDVFQKTLNIKNPDTIKEIVEKLSKLNLITIDSDIKGDAFEYFLKQSITVGNDLGEYFTPRHIVKLLVKFVDPMFGDTVYDPCCGTGGFLIEAYKHIWNKCKHTKRNMKRLQEKTIFGRESTGTAKIAKMNMILAGDGHTNIKQIDSLSSPVKKRYDVVLTNFPFSQETDYGNLYGFNTKDANPIFIKHIIDSLKIGGTAGIVTFQGALYDKSEVYKKIRRLMIDNCEIKAIVKLHNYVFRPYTGVNTSLIILKKGGKTKKVWFYVVGEDGFEKTGSAKGRRPIKENDIKHLQEIWGSKLETEKSWLVDIETIKNNDYNLNAEFYKPKEIEVANPKMVKLRDYVEIIRGYEVGSRFYCSKGQGIPFIRVGNLTNKRKLIYTNSEKRIEAKKTDILMSFDGTIGIVRRGLEGAISAGIKIIRSKDETVFSNDFLFLMLSSEEVRTVLNKHTKTSTIMHAGKAIEFIEIPLLPIKMQQQLAEGLSIKQKKIDAIDRLLKVYSSNIVDSDLFNADAHEELRNLIISEPQNGLYKSKSFYGEGTPIIRIDNIYDGQLVIDKIKRLKLDKKELGTFKLDRDDIVLNRVNSEEYVGKCGIYGDEFADCVFESNMMRFRVDKRKILPHFLVFYLTSKKGKMQILSKIKRAINQVSINQEDVKSIKIPSLALTEQQKIVDEVSLQNKTIQNLKSIRISINRDMKKELTRINKIGM